MAVSDLILKIRDTLGDSDGDRWSDTRIIRAINDAQDDICRKVNLLRAKSSINILGGVSQYELPDDSLLLTRVTLEGVTIPFKSVEEMDAIDENWEAAQGDEIKAIVYNELNRGVIRVYPIPTLDIPTDPSAVPDFGFVTEMVGVVILDDFGVLTQLYDIKDDLAVHYTRKPTAVTDVTNTIELDEIWHQAIKYFVCGTLLRDDKDTQNRTMGNEELQLYVGELLVAKSTASRDFAKSTGYQSDYRKL